ncbi:hypothetical protein THC_0486 [Caldimicrobium thiodismutans]|jgi:Tfp pilus assembly protein PilF|uniref:Uncharacterized protein n=1 Tax=Caldimicrobium thiodismutans TaxID=1653476 RepID=A0A0U5B4A6_9BACT|nr:tetratricopeptide repeat protein [Caldimicrobium thiodismutans]BAU22880.1 hypothetical protein THC_0486 [Caldimicrobium thiodismutans]
MRKVLLSLVFVLVFIASSYAQFYIDLCYTYLNAGDYQRAIEAGKQAVKLNPNDSDSYYCLTLLSDTYFIK